VDSEGLRDVVSLGLLVMVCISRTCGIVMLVKSINIRVYQQTTSSVLNLAEVMRSLRFVCHFDGVQDYYKTNLPISLKLGVVTGPIPVGRTGQLLVVIRFRIRIPDHFSTSLTLRNRGF